MVNIYFISDNSCYHGRGRATGWGRARGRGGNRRLGGSNGHQNGNINIYFLESGEHYRRGSRGWGGSQAQEGASSWEGNRGLERARGQGARRRRGTRGQGRARGGRGYGGLSKLETFLLAILAAQHLPIEQQYLARQLITDALLPEGQEQNQQGQQLQEQLQE